MEQQKQPLWTKSFILISIANLLMFCGFQILLPTLPIYAKTLGGSDAALGWLIGSSTVASLLIRPISGMVMDKAGRKGILIGGICIIILVTMTYGWLPTVGVIIAARFIHGVGWAMASTASSTIASDKIPKNRFGEGMGFFSLSSSLSIAIAPSVGLTLLNKQSFSSIIVLSSGLSIAVLFLSIFLKGEKTPKANESIKPAPYEKSSVLPSVVMFFTSATYGSLTSFLSLYALDKGISNIGMFFTIYAIFLLVLRPIYGKLTDRFGFHVVVFPGLVLVAAAMILLSMADTMFMFLVIAAIYGMGFSGLQSSLQTMAVINAPKERIGAANATFFTGFDGGIGFGSVIGGILAAAFGYGKMYMSLSILVVISAVMYFVVSIRKKA